MIFEELSLADGVVKALAIGHATDVVSAFHHLADVALKGQGPWRITYVHGYFSETLNTQLDSDMRWELRAERKADIDSRPRLGYHVYSRNPPVQEERA